MKILIYTRAFAPKIGGQETILMLLAQGLATQSCLDSKEPVEVTVVTPILAQEMDDGQLPFRIVRRPGMLTLFRLFRRTDIVHLAGAMIIPLVVGFLLRKAIVIEHHGFQPICPNGQLLYEETLSLCPGHFMAGRYHECIRCNANRGILRSVKMWALTFPRRWLSQRVDANLLPTEWLGSQLRLNHMETIVHGLPSFISAEPDREVTPESTFSFVGRLVSTKGIRVLLEATQRVKASGLLFRVQIIGQGPDRELLEDLVRQMGIEQHVKFFGYLPDEQLARILRNSSAIIMPSLAGEVFGLSAAENMLKGRLVIASDLGSLSEVIADSGMIFPVGDSAALGRLMLRVIENPDLSVELGRAARERILKYFDFDKMIREHCLLYRKLLAQRN